MPSLRISFPEKESPSVVVLSGKRITIGRLPQNTIQILDRTISAYHAELIEEEGHYRLHDLGATNGILVNGEPVTDFHLKEACKVSFGSVECEFNLEAPAESEADPDLALLTHGQSAALLQKNAELEKTVASLREEIAELTKPAAEGEGQSEHQRLTVEITSLKEALTAKDHEIQELKTNLSVLRRDRTNLERALNVTKAKPVEPVFKPVAKAPAAPATPEEPAAAETPEPAPAPVTPVAPAAAGAPAIAEVPKQPTPMPTARPAAVPIPAPVSKPAFVPGANAPAAKPSAPTATPAAPATPAAKPSLPKPKAPLPHATPAAPAAATAPSTPGAPTARPVPVAKPIAKPQPGVAPGNGNGNPTGTPRPASYTKSPAAGANLQATPKPSLATRPPTAVSGPKGTQKIDT